MHGRTLAVGVHHALNRWNVVFTFRVTRIVRECNSFHWVQETVANLAGEYLLVNFSGKLANLTYEQHFTQ
jgi:hypothetical protein